MDATAVLEAIGAARAETCREAELEIREIESRRDTHLARLDSAERVLNGSSGPAREDTAATTETKPTEPSKQAPPRRPSVKKRVRRKHLSPASPQQLSERRDKTARLLEESREGLSLGEIVHALGLTPHKAKLAIAGLIEEGRIESVGSGPTTRYVIANPASAPLSRQAPTQGTLEERIVAILEDRHHATAEELGQAVGEPVSRVAEACGRLQSEERIRMARINDRRVYVLAVRV